MPLAPNLLAILADPVDKGPLLERGDRLYNPRLRRLYEVRGGVPLLLEADAEGVPEDEHERWAAEPRDAAADGPR